MVTSYVETWMRSFDIQIKWNMYLFVFICPLEYPCSSLCVQYIIKQIPLRKAPFVLWHRNWYFIPCIYNSPRDFRQPCRMLYSCTASAETVGICFQHWALCLQYWTYCVLNSLNRWHVTEWKLILALDPTRIRRSTFQQDRYDVQIVPIRIIFD